MSSLRWTVLVLLVGSGWLLNWLLLGLSQGVLVITSPFCDWPFACVSFAYVVSALTIAAAASAPLLLATFMLGRLAKNPSDGHWPLRSVRACLLGFLGGSILLSVSLQFAAGGLSRTLATVLTQLPALGSLVALATFAVKSLSK